jgi:hypothetical protein
MIVLTILALAEVVLSGSFLYFYLIVDANEYVLGGLMAAQLIVIAFFLISYYKTCVNFVELSEDREEEYLW